MSGGSFSPNTICQHDHRARQRAPRHPLRVVTSDQKVWVPRKAGFVYPDVTALCGRAEPYPGAPDVLTNPLLIIEVLSEGPSLHFRGEKFEGYRSIPSLRHYLMLSSRHPLVEHYARDDDDAWLLRTYGARTQ
ncbi:MAG: Uma2 family endonuclease [Deltaproteobacteria bacterium]|nr:Uma2 family endonuclease [Deltaproteobacteria bacterium]